MSRAKVLLPLKWAETISFGSNQLYYFLNLAIFYQRPLLHAYKVISLKMLDRDISIRNWRFGQRWPSKHALKWPLNCPNESGCMNKNFVWQVCSVLTILKSWKYKIMQNSESTDFVCSSVITANFEQISIKRFFRFCLKETVHFGPNDHPLSIKSVHFWVDSPISQDQFWHPVLIRLDSLTNQSVNQLPIFALSI